LKEIKCYKLGFQHQQNNCTILVILIDIINNDGQTLCIIQEKQGESEKPQLSR